MLIGAAATTGEAIPFELLSEADAPYVVVHMETNSHSKILYLQMER
jgi:hypothetical protein